MSIMSFRPLIFLGVSCALAFALAIYAFLSGAGFLAAFMIYSFGGSAMLVAFSTISYIRHDQETVVFAGQEKLSPIGQLQGV